MANPKILLIAGHGAGDPGATAAHNGVTYKEADLTRQVVEQLWEEMGLYQADVTVYPTDRNAYQDYMSGKLQVDLGAYDYVLEIHFNAFRPGGRDGKNKGTEIYVTSGRKELSVSTDILDQVTALGFTDRGVKKYDWAVIAAAHRKGTDAALAEICFIDDPDDMDLYLANKTEIPVRLAHGLAEGLNLKLKPSAPTEEEITVQNAVADGILTSPDYWLAVLRGEKTASAANIKALMDKYHKALTK